MKTKVVLFYSDPHEWMNEIPNCPYLLAKADAVTECVTSYRFFFPEVSSNTLTFDQIEGSFLMICTVGNLVHPIMPTGVKTKHFRFQDVPSGIHLPEPTWKYEIPDCPYLLAFQRKEHNGSDTEEEEEKIEECGNF